MKTFNQTFLIIFFILVSCTENGTRTNIDPEKGPVYDCMKESALSRYLNNLNLLAEIFEEDKIITSSRASYGEALVKMFDHEYGDYQLEPEQSIKLDFSRDIGSLAVLCQCSEEAKEFNELTAIQKEFYYSLADIAYSGSHDNKKLGELINEMSDNEFESFGIKEAATIYLSTTLMRQYYVFNYVEN